MPKQIVSPVKRFSGTVTLAEPLNFPQAVAYEEAQKTIQTLRDAGEVLTDFKARQIWLPAILACVESWELAGIPEQPTIDTFPATPARSVAELIGWLITEISALFKEEVDLPPD